jgi:autotransporter-associated beta strand protein
MNLTNARKFLSTAAALVALLATSAPSFADNGIWTSTTGGLWSDTNNWSGGIVADGADNFADFNSVDLPAGTSTVRLDSARTITSLIFGDTATATAGTWSLTNNGNPDNILTLASSSGTPTITNSVSTTISLSLAGTQGLVKAGAGTLTLTGINTYSGATTVNGGNFRINTGGLVNGGALTTGSFSGAKLQVNGGTLISSTLATINESGSGFQLSSGSATFNGGIKLVSSSDVSPLILVDGGRFTATDVEITRNKNYGTGTAPTAAETATGFYVSTSATNAVVNVGTLRIGTSNSGGTARIDAGTVTTGTTSVGLNTATGRWNAFQVNGGTFTSNAIIVSANAGFANRAIMLLTGGTTTADSITLGAGGSGAVATVTMSGASTNLYVGSGGIASNGSGTFTTNLNGGTLGAKADWTGSVNLTIGGGVTIKAADVNDGAHNITLNGTLADSSAITKLATDSLPWARIIRVTLVRLR